MKGNKRVRSGDAVVWKPVVALEHLYRFECCCAKAALFNLILNDIKPSISERYMEPADRGTAV